MSELRSTKNIMEHTTKRKRTPVLLAALFTGLIALQPTPGQASPAPCDSCMNDVSLRTEIRKLWSDHVMWTRNVIINFVDGTPGKAEAVDRLLKNQDDIGNAIKPFYGDAAGDALTKLLKEHIVVAADILTAAKAGKTTEFEAAVAKWYRNGEEIAVFLSNANPGNWKPEDMKKMMKDHLDLTLEEASARLNKDYAADVAAYDKAYAEILMMADGLAKGIELQFPEKFKTKKTR